MLPKKVSAAGSRCNAGVSLARFGPACRPSLLLAIVPTLILGLAACSSPPAGTRYELRGTVVAVQPQHRLVTVAHEDIPGFMAAMTMPFAVKEEWALAALKPGDRIAAVLVVDRGASWLEQIVISHGGAQQLAPVKADGSPVAAPGQPVPDFTLLNQYGRLIHLHQYRGRALLLTFIYTRCPLPDYCPLTSRNFAELDRALRREPSLYPKTALLSISIDPEYDRPAVLRKYGLTYTDAKGPNPFDQWELATGSPREIKAVAGFFGLDYYPQGNQIVHSLRTALIAPDGRIAKTYSGNEWKPAEVLRDLAALRR
jgi:protein SCO1/2